MKTKSVKPTKPVYLLSAHLGKTTLAMQKKRLYNITQKIVLTALEWETLSNTTQFMKPWTNWRQQTQEMGKNNLVLPLLLTTIPATAKNPSSVPMSKTLRKKTN